MLDRTTRWNARVATQIISISETTKLDLVERYGVRPDKISVVHHGVSARFRRPSPAEISRVRTSLGLPERYILAVGTIQPRKNLVRLAKAVAQLRVEYPDVALVLAGRRGWMAEEVLAEVHAALPSDALHQLSYVTDGDLPALYGSAAAVATVSTYEGFGLPVLEAMACNAPVVISDTPALVEVAGGAAAIATAHSATAIADAIRSVLSGQIDLRATGLVRSAQFTWDRCAIETLAVLQRVIDARH